MRISWILTAVLLAGASSGCLRLMDEPTECMDDEDCVEGDLCKADPEGYGEICLPAEWCDDNYDCRGAAKCLVAGSECVPGPRAGTYCVVEDDCGGDLDLKCHDDLCRPLGGTDGYCEQSSDCADGYVCGDYDLCTCDSPECEG